VGAVLWLLEALGPEGAGVLSSIWCDLTDEDALRAPAGSGVGPLVAEAPRASAAASRPRDPDEVREVLEGLASRLEEGGG
jgi:hypothetical protein